jgi:hypothetical protein
VSIPSVTLPSPNEKSQQDASDDPYSRIEPRDQTSTYDTRSALGSCAYGFSLFRVCRCELRSLIGRIREAHETGLYRWGVAVLPRWFGALIGQEYLSAQRCCNEDTQKILQSHKWMSLSDTLVFLQGWTLGAAWAYSRSRTQYSSPIQSASGNFASTGEVGEARQSYAAPSSSPSVQT